MQTADTERSMNTYAAQEIQQEVVRQRRWVVTMNMFWGKKSRQTEKL